MEKLDCLIVGFGSITQTMLKPLRTKPWYRTVGVVDVRPEARELAANALSLPSDTLFDTLPAALEQVPNAAVIINTPSELHYQQARAALDHGGHVLVAKPITNSFADALALVDLAAARRTTLAVGQQMRFRRHYLAVAQFLASGQLGTVEMITYINAKPRHQALNLTAMAQPALYEMSCHHFDCLMALLPGHVPLRITCDGFQPSWSVYHGPCMVNGLIEYSGGVHVLYQGGFSSQADSYELRLEGTRGALRCRGIHMSNDQMTYEFAERGGSFAPIDPERNVPQADPWDTFFDCWFDYVKGGAEPPFSGRQNLQVFALLSAGIDSINGGTPMAVGVAENAAYAAAFSQ